jgi:formylglycine-generating enzyme required for sulfatase activity
VGVRGGGGGQQLEFPWGSTPPGTSNQYAIYGQYYDIPPYAAPVGTASLGAALWGQLDMAGNAYEWTLDWYAAYVDPCTDCSYLAAASGRVFRGGCDDEGATYLLPTYRTSVDPSTRANGWDVLGFRCARVP